MIAGNQSSPGPSKNRNHHSPKSAYEKCGLNQCPKEKYCYGATEEEWFFDDTQIEVTGKKFEKATFEHWRGGQKHLISYNWIKHQPQGCTSARLYAVLRHKREDDMFWDYCYIEVETGRGTTPAESKAAFERHRLKGECERRFSEILSDMGLHRPPCHSLGANDAWYTLGAIAYNLLGAMKLLVLPEKDLAKRPRTIMQRLLLLPMELKAHARQLKAVISICAERLKVWEAIFAEWLPDHRLNRQSG